MARFSECSLECASKLLDTTDIVREAICRQLAGEHRYTHLRQICKTSEKPSATAWWILHGQLVGFGGCQFVLNPVRSGSCDQI
jgi:hypothetical protein